MSLMCRLDLARIEGLGISFMCSNLVDVRTAALDVLFTARHLHGALLAAGGRSTPATPIPSSNPPTPGKQLRLHAAICLRIVHLHGQQVGDEGAYRHEIAEAC